MATNTTGTMELVDSLRRGIEGRDAALLTSLYADDAQILRINRDHPAGAPQSVLGKEAIAEVYRDVFSRELTHHIKQQVVDGDRIALTEECTYPDGTRVLSMVMIESHDGQIVRETDMEEWGE